MFTVGQLAELSGVTVKTLHHYHRLGLVIPRQTTDAGYRLYGQDELERLQEILFYRELDLSLSEIKKALKGDRSRIATLGWQKARLLDRQRRLGLILETIDRSLSRATGGNPMSAQEIFQGFTPEEWNTALSDQNEHLSREYGEELRVVSDTQAQELNEAAREASSFLHEMVAALRQGIPHSAPEVLDRVGRHIAFLNQSRPTTPASYLATTEFLAGDSFHGKVFEGMQVGLSAYLVASAHSYGQGR